MLPPDVKIKLYGKNNHNKHMSESTILTTFDAHLMVGSTKDYFLLSKVHSLLAAWTLAWHPDCCVEGF